VLLQPIGYDDDAILRKAGAQDGGARPLPTRRLSICSRRRVGALSQIVIGPARLAPVVKVIHEQIGIEHGVITTLHDITNTQVVVDAPHTDLRRARASSLSLIPARTGSATATGLIFAL